MTTAGTRKSIPRTLIALGALLIMVLAALAFLMQGGGEPAETDAPRLNPDGVEAFWGHSIDGRQVPCFTLMRNSGAAITCDWDTALIPPLEDVSTIK